MKRIKNYIIIAAGILLTACSADNEGAGMPECSTIPIDFDASDAYATRGSECGTGWGTAPGSAMAMWAYYYQDGSSTPQSMMQENKLEYNSSNHRWEYSPIIFWPKQGEMDFFAYAPYAPAGGGARAEFTTFSPSHINHQAILLNCHVPKSVITTVSQLQTLTVDPNDAVNQHDLMFAFQRRVKCAEQSVTSSVNMRFAHVMACIKFGVESSDATFNLPANTAKVVFGIGRLKTGGTLAICEPATPGGEPDVVWTLDGQEGTFYYTVPITSGSMYFSNEEFFFPPQDIEGGLVVTAYFFDSAGKRLEYHTITPQPSITKLERGKRTVLKLTSSK